MKRSTLLVVIILTGVALSPYVNAAPTYVKGNLVNAVWGPSGSPYIVEDDCTVPAGEKLEIKAGTTIIMGKNTSINVLGSITAEGDKDNRIVFTSGNDSILWNKIAIYINDSNVDLAGSSKFRYCDFKNAMTALALEISGVDSTLETEIINCRFSYCYEYCIMGKAKGERYQTGTECKGGSPSLNPIISNCIFSSSFNGIGMAVTGIIGDCGGAFEERYGFASPEITNNIFKIIVGTAVDMINDPYSRDSEPKLINNLFVKCKQGIQITDPYDKSEITNNIFSGNLIAISTTTEDELSITYNCFHNTAITFQGFTTPPNSGVNIFGDPLFMNPDTGNYHLLENSPCIDAGDPVNTQDNCFPPSLGKTAADMGVYGGAGACESNSLPNTPTLVSPEDVAVEILVNVALEWACDDPDGDILTYDIYLGTKNPPPFYAGIKGKTLFSPNTLDNNAVYYWMITARDTAGEETQGPVWRFITSPGEDIYSTPQDVDNQNDDDDGLCFIHSIL